MIRLCLPEDDKAADSAGVGLAEGTNEKHT